MRNPASFRIARLVVLALVIAAFPTLHSSKALATAQSSELTSHATQPTLRRMEKLDRGLIAVPTTSGVLVSWRLLGTEPLNIGFNLYRNDQQINTAPITAGTNYLDAAGTSSSVYSVRAILNGSEQPASADAQVWANPYLDVPLQRPAGGTTPDGIAYTYSANDASVGDLDGDGQYEIVLKWDPSNAQDNAFHGYTGPVIFDAYTLAGAQLWRINMGHNIRAGAHYTQFLVADFDGDGRSELVAKTGDGTVDGVGNVIGDPNADWRVTGGQVPTRDRTGAVMLPDGTLVAPLQGRILSGPEYLTVFDGLTGAALATTDYIPARHPETNNPTPEQMTETWGDGYANRSDRFLAAVAYLDGEHPSIVMARGYYERTVLAAWDWRGGQLTHRWTFDSDVAGNEDFAGQGNHNLGVTDVDGDGRDEIVYGSMTVDDDGSGLWSARLFHGDALHVSDLDPTRPGLEVFGPHECPACNGGIGTAMLDARTGAVLWSTPANRDIGRGVALDIDPRHAGNEAWAAGSNNLYNARGQLIGTTHPPQINFGIWWDGDLLRELLDQTQISKWDWQTNRANAILAAQGVSSNNGTKATPALSADILGDWREEVIWRTTDSSALRIYATPFPTEHRFVTLMHDPTYRLAVAWQNVAYNQPPHPGYFLGHGMAQPPQPLIRTGALIAASLNLDPDTWNLKHNGPRHATAYIELPQSSAGDIVVSTVRLFVGGTPISAEIQPASVGDHDGNGIPDLMVKFDGQALSAALAGHSGNTGVRIIGYLVSGDAFAGDDLVNVKS
ncbi:MAG TPA: rhamnogalacturonan lyase [Herpetosiphonaceae bacterium]